MLLEDEIAAVKRLLAPKARNRIDVRTRIRALAIMESSIRGARVEPSDSDLNKILSKIKQERPAKEISPGVASLDIAVDGEESRLVFVWKRSRVCRYNSFRKVLPERP